MIKGKYYRISEVSTITGLPKSIIRQWEREFPIIKPLRRGGCRYYSKEDVENILKIKNLLYEEKYSIEGVKEIILKGRKVSSPLSATVDFLKSVVESLKEILEELEESKTYGSVDSGKEHKEEL